MASIYRILYEHWRGSDRDALEPFLTRALADLLQRISNSNPELIKDLILNTFLNTSRRTRGADAENCWTAFKKTIGAADRLDWHPELGIPESGKRRVDLCLLLKNVPILIVENKVTASFTEGQLKTYGTWLAANAQHVGVLVLLTHSTPPPEDFLDDGLNYGVALRSICYWTQLYQWIQKTSLADEFTNGLRKEFCGFLESRDMNGITGKELETLSSVLAHGIYDKVNPLFQGVRDQVAPALTNWGYVFDRGRINAWAYGHGHAVWDWCYFRDRKTKWYIAWGLTAKGSQFFEDPSIENSFVVFAYVNSDPASKKPLAGLPHEHRNALIKSGWIVSDRGDCWKTSDAMALVSHPGGFSQSFAEWLRKPLQEGNDILEKAHSRLMC